MKKYRKPFLSQQGKYLGNKPAFPIALSGAMAVGAVAAKMAGNDKSSSGLPSLDKCLSK